MSSRGRHFVTDPELVVEALPARSYANLKMGKLLTFDNPEAERDFVAFSQRGQLQTPMLLIYTHTALSLAYSLLLYLLNLAVADFRQSTVFPLVFYLSFILTVPLQLESRGDEGLPLLELHLERIKASAAELGSSLARCTRLPLVSWVCASVSCDCRRCRLDSEDSKA